jgi:hypothetical protein
LHERPSGTAADAAFPREDAVFYQFGMLWTLFVIPFLIGLGIVISLWNAGAGGDLGNRSRAAGMAIGVLNLCLAAMNTALFGLRGSDLAWKVTVAFAPIAVGTINLAQTLRRPAPRRK